MSRNAFYSFYFKQDNWRASQVRMMGVIEGNQPASDNEWESITGGSNPDAKIVRWINDQMYGKSVAIVLINSGTAGRKWIDYEIKKAWKDKKGVLGIHIHALKNRLGVQGRKGKNPFELYKIGTENLADVAPVYEPPYSTSTRAYAFIKDNLADWIEEAIEIRKEFK